MDTRLKHRIVGLLVLLALAVIFLPELLDGKKAYRQPQFAPMPENSATVTETADVVFLEPEAKPQAEVAESSVEPAPAAPPQVQEAVVAPSKSLVAAQKKVEKAQIEEDKAAGDTRLKQFDSNAWVIRLGVFSHRDNVIRLVDKLRKQGYTTFTKPLEPVQGQATRVYIGPELSKAKLTKLLPELKQKVNLQGKIYPYNPLVQ